MGLVYAIANQKGGVGKTTTAVNTAACVAAGGPPGALSSTSTSNATPPSRSAATARAMPAALRLPHRRRRSVAEARAPGGPDNLWLVPASRDLAGAAVELPRIEGSEHRLRESLGPVRDRFA